MLFTFPVCMHLLVVFWLEHDLLDFRISGLGAVVLGFIFSLFLIYGIADNLPVFSWVLTLNSLIINTIHFSGLHAFTGGYLSEHDS